MKLKFGIKEVVAIGIGTALFVALTEIQIPTVLTHTCSPVWRSWPF